MGQNCFDFTEFLNSSEPLFPNINAYAKFQIHERLSKLKIGNWADRRMEWRTLARYNITRKVSKRHGCPRLLPFGS